MDEKEFVMDFLRLAELMEEVESLQKKLAPVIIEKGKSQAIGGLKASYRKPSISYDYHQAMSERYPDGFPAGVLDIIEGFTTERISTSWKAVCDHFGIESYPVVSQKPASVTFKLDNA